MTVPTTTSALLVRALDAARAAVLAHKDDIAALDREIGDGDHVHNLLRGLDAVLAEREALERDDLTPALRRVANALLAHVGGSAGPLLASLALGMARAAREPLTLTVLAEMVGGGVDALRLRGRADGGEKTMLDVLLPVAACLAREADAGASPERAAREVRRVAEAGMLATRDMVATKGRAAFLGERSRGVVDPGARSCQVMIEAMCGLIAPDVAAPNATPDASPDAAPDGAAHPREVR